MQLYQLHAKQNLPIHIQKAWDFFTDPNNLKIITPPEMGFQILSGAERKMYSGQIIHYLVSPLAGFKIQWVTEITHVDDHIYFVDEQRFGPYKLWHHKHFLKVIDGGVEMEDIVHYKLPFGIIGDILHKLFVRKKLETIFEFRKAKLIELFGEY